MMMKKEREENISSRLTGRKTHPGFFGMGQALADLAQVSEFYIFFQDKKRYVYETRRTFCLLEHPVEKGLFSTHFSDGRRIFSH